MAREIKFSLVYRDMWQSSGKYVPRVDQLVQIAPVIIDMGCFDRVETNGGAFEQVNLLFGENPNKAVRAWTAPFNKVGILNTKLPVMLACVLINVPLIIWFLISFFQDLPEEVEESAKVDGATEWQLFCRIVLPLVAPGIAAVAMLSFMYAWNEYTYTVIFTRSPANNTVPLALSVLNTEDNLTNFGLVAAGGVMSVIPITLFVIFAQNYLISGLSSGAVKE